MCDCERAYYTVVFDWKGCRRGDPIPPYLFMLCLDIIGIMVKENELIRCITINDDEYKIAQFADDTQMMSEGV